MPSTLKEDPHQRRPDVNTRRYGLDALRAFAMLLGVALHAALSFVEIPWVVQDRFRSAGFGLMVSAIHGFRMPLFFLISGFFTAMLWRKRGLRGLLQQRVRRIALPLLLGCVTIVPAMWAISIWAKSGNMTYGETDTGKDIWTAAAYGNLEVVRYHVERGASIDDEEPVFGQSPLGWAVIGDRLEVIAYLLEAGADPSARYRDRNTALHTAAFFGRAEAAVRLLKAGADVNARNHRRETPLDVMRHGQGTTEFIAGILRVPLDFDAVTAGRDRIRDMLESHAAISGLAESKDAASDIANVDAPTRHKKEEPGRFGGLLSGLMIFPFFHHLWFLWMLCWLVAGFSLVVLLFSLLPRVPVPSVLIASPLCLIWLVPLTMITQSSMHFGGAMPGFGPDTSAGIVPIPHVLAHYAIFFGFGSLMYAYGTPEFTGRLGCIWWIQLPVALLLLPAALAFGLHIPLGSELTCDESTRRLLANLGQVFYAWLMIFGLIGLFETVLGRERASVRYLSDASYWLYLVHLPLVIAGQALLRGVNLPAIVKFTLLTAASTAILLGSYQLVVRYGWIGRLLNGPRSRSGPSVEGK